MKVSARFEGTLVLPKDRDFDRSRAVYNSFIDDMPAAIFYCESETDVCVAVRAAGDAGLQVAVRATGHSVSGRSIRTGAAVIDLSRMRGVSGSSAPCVTAAGGAVWRDFDSVTQRLGIAVTGGTVSSTGVAGLTLGGGVGWLLPSAGLACDSLMAVRLVTPDGIVREVDDASEPGLMECLRGLGHGLGVVTQFEFTARPLGDLIAGSVVLAPERITEEKLDAVCSLMNDPPSALMFSPALLYRDGCPVLSLDLALHNPRPADVARIQSLAAGADTIGSTVRQREYLSLQTMLDVPSRLGLRAWWRPRYLSHVTSELLRTMIECYLEAPSRESIVFFEHYHGAYNDPPYSSAFPGRAERHSILITASWRGSEEDQANLAWLDATTHALQPWTNTTEPYLNYSSTLVRSGFEGPALYREAKRRIDPDGLFVDAFPPLGRVPQARADSNEGSGYVRSRRNGSHREFNAD